MTRTVFIFHLDDDEKRGAYYCNGCNVEEDETIYTEPIGKPVHEFQQRLMARRAEPRWHGADADLKLSEIQRFTFVFIVDEHEGLVCGIRWLRRADAPSYEEIMA